MDNTRSMELDLDTDFAQDDDDEYVEELEDEDEELEDEDEDDYGSDDSDDEIELPKVSNWIDSDGTVIHGVEVINDDDSEINNLSNTSSSCGFDVCSICLKSWNTRSKHRICCLPCGHIYGMSCIKKWLLQHESSRKCPQCNASCTFEDVILLYATRLCLSHHKEPSTTRFPFTVKGFTAFQGYVSQRQADAVRLQQDVSRRKDEVLSQVIPLRKKLAHLSKQQYYALARRAYTLGRCSIALDKRDALERRANALQHRADVLGRQVHALERRCDSLDRRADALKRRWRALGRLDDAYGLSISFVKQKYREHYIRKAGKKNPNTKHELE